MAGSLPPPPTVWKQIAMAGAQQHNDHYGKCQQQEPCNLSLSQLHIARLQWARVIRHGCIPSRAYLSSGML
jgi:hypothetical protein